MPWIDTIPPGHADDKLKSLYDQVFALMPPEYMEEVEAVVGPDGKADSVITTHSLMPNVMFHMFSAFGHMLSPELPLSRRQQEMITTLVSALNSCRY